VLHEVAADNHVALNVIRVQRASGAAENHNVHVKLVNQNGRARRSVGLAETDLGRIHWGQDATIATDTYPGKQYHGRISFIASDAEFTPKSVQT